MAKKHKKPDKKQAERFREAARAVDAGENGEAFERALKTQLITVSDYDEAVNMLLAGAIDALVADMPICRLSLMRFPNEDLATLKEPLTIEPIGIALPGNDPMLRNLMDNYLDAFEKTGILEQLRKKWLEDGAWIAALP